MYIKLLLIIFVLLGKDDCSVVVEVEGDINVGVVLNNCRSNISEVIPFEKQSLVSTALWTVHRINFLQTLSPIKLGIKVYETCSENDYFKTIFDIYEEDTYYLGVVAEHLNQRQLKFGELLDIREIQVTQLNSLLIKATIKVLNALNWMENVTIVAPDNDVVNELYKMSKNGYICIKECIVYKEKCTHGYNISNPLVFFGNKHQIEEFLKIYNHEDFTEENDVLFVPLDGSVPQDLPHKSFVLIPPHNPATRIYKTDENIIPSPLFLYTAKAILTYTKNVEHFIEKNCNETVYKVNCLRSKFNKRYRPIITTPTSILESLKIETLKPDFIYDIYRAENGTNITNNFLQPLSKIFSYNIFFDNLTILDSTFNITKEVSKCINYYQPQNHFNFFINIVSNLSFRSEAWVCAFLSLSLLGVLVCISILIFILISICRRDILEGNPILTISLLVSIMILFCSVLPFSLEDNKIIINSLCLAKSLSITLGYAMVFALLLSRCILLATSTKEIGFMSHIAGPVQAFLCLFIFGVQAALSLQVIGRCVDIFCSTSFIYLLSYNIMLLLLLLCLCPLIYKNERNYREGKYFCVAIILTSMIWIVWLLLYMCLDSSWNEPMLCLGLVGTAGGFLGAIFIPRTYLMTIAAARNKITSTLPSLNTANSIVDIYRSNTQPIYDCVNMAAINAVNVARAGLTVPSTQAMHHPDLYSCPALPEDEDLDFTCDTPTANDKITRF